MTRLAKEISQKPLTLSDSEKVIGFRCTVQLKYMLIGAALAKGISLSEYVLSLVQKALNNEKLGIGGTTVKNAVNMATQTIDNDEYEIKKLKFENEQLRKQLSEVKEYAKTIKETISAIEDATTGTVCIPKFALEYDKEVEDWLKQAKGRNARIWRSENT